MVIEWGQIAADASVAATSIGANYLLSKNAMDQATDSQNAGIANQNVWNQKALDFERDQFAWDQDRYQDSLTRYDDSVGKSDERYDQNIVRDDQRYDDSVGRYDAALAKEEGRYQQGRDDTQPFRDASSGAISSLADKVNAGPGDFTKSPGYDFRLQEGVNALDRSAASKGKLLSGQQDKAITKYGQDYASAEYDKFLNQYYQSLTPFQSLAGVGQTATGNGASTPIPTVNGGSNVGMPGVGTFNGPASNNNMSSLMQNMGTSAFNAGNAQAANPINFANNMGNVLNQNLSTIDTSKWHG